ncbi:hypothetical protein CTAYLR_000239 [Chrysophaeum taylorii]|uniref:Uncharacterized protein n=1 Tax=Chrysophaeum taylorii TaxID=2483200 RepID=A0AAD7UF54_9STRA|nr:hypothetical protein CTAYLR_000239 [Chrysophaeum taylorii]
MWQWIAVSVASGYRFDPTVEACQGGVDGLCDWMTQAGKVDTSCRFTIRSGLQPSSSTAPPELRTSPAMHLWFDTNRGPFGQRAIVVDPLNSSIVERHGPIVCMYANVDVEPPAPAILMVVNSFDYLYHLWPNFVNKILWARSVNMNIAVFIGELSSEIANSIGPECSRSRVMQLFRAGEDPYHNAQRRRRLARSYYSLHGRRDDLNSNHHIKMISTYAMLDHPLVGGVFYFDMDTFAEPLEFGNRSSLEEKLLNIHVDNKVDVLFENSHSRDLFWHVPGRLYYVRDTMLARRFIAGWLHFRCGFKDQYSLWHNVLTLAREEGCLKYHGEIFRFAYKEAQHAILTPQVLRRYPHLKLDCAARHELCPRFRFCDDTYSLSRNVLTHKGIFSRQTCRFNFFSAGTGRMHTLEVGNMLNMSQHAQFLQRPNAGCDFLLLSLNLHTISPDVFF